MSVIELERPEADGAKRPDFLQYRDHAAEVVDSLRQAGFVAAIECQVNQGANRHFREQAEVIIHAQAACRLDKMKASMTERHKINDAKVALIHYNHAVRNLIWNNPGAVFTDDLTEWLRESTGDEVWAEGIVSGAAGEVAVARAVQDLGGVTGVRLADIEEDRRGMDVVAEVDSGKALPSLIAIDVKTRHHLMQGDRFLRKQPEWIDGRRYYQCKLGVEAGQISAGARLDERAYWPQLGKLQDYIHAVGRRGRQAMVV